MHRKGEAGLYPMVCRNQMACGEKDNINTVDKMTGTDQPRANNFVFIFDVRDQNEPLRRVSVSSFDSVACCTNISVALESMIGKNLLLSWVGIDQNLAQSAAR